MNPVGPVTPHDFSHERPPATPHLDQITDDGYRPLKSILVLAKLPLRDNFARLQRNTFDPVSHSKRVIAVGSVIQPSIQIATVAEIL
jgi:hypothetical protein